MPSTVPLYKIPVRYSCTRYQLQVPLPKCCVEETQQYASYICTCTSTCTKTQQKQQPTLADSTNHLLPNILNISIFFRIPESTKVTLSVGSIRNFFTDPEGSVKRVLDLPLMKCHGNQSPGIPTYRPQFWKEYFQFF
jgi:hypothetical protein